MIVRNLSRYPIIVGPYRVDPGKKAYISDGFYFEHKEVFDSFFQQKKLKIEVPPTVGYIGRPSGKDKFQDGFVPLSEWDTVADALDRLNVLLEEAIPKVRVEIIEEPTLSVSIGHGFGTFDLIISAYNSNGQQVLPRISDQTNNLVELEFDEPFSGKIVLLGVKKWQSL